MEEPQCARSIIICFMYDIGTIRTENYSVCMVWRSCIHKDQNLFIFVQLWQNGQKRKIFENCFIIYSKIIISWWKTYKKNFFYYFLELTQNHAQSCRRLKKGKVLKNFQFHIVKLSFFDEKLMKNELFSPFSRINTKSCSIMQKGKQIEHFGKNSNSI